jgi:hypothetical protein
VSIDGRGDICDIAIDVANQTLCSLAAPGPDSSVQCAQVSQMVSVGVACLELHEEFQCRLIRLRLQTFDNFCPVLCEHVGASATRFVSQSAMLEMLDNDTASAGIAALTFHSPVQRTVLPNSKLAGELQA